MVSIKIQLENIYITILEYVTWKTIQVTCNLTGGKGERRHSFNNQYHTGCFYCKYNTLSFARQKGSNTEGGGTQQTQQLPKKIL